MEGVFVNSTVEGFEGFTDFGYYIDGDADYHTSEGFEELVERDEAYAVKVSRDISGKVQIILESANREKRAEIEEDVGIRRSGLDRTFYHKDTDPVLPHHFEDRRESSEVLTTLAKYALEHGESDETEVNGVNWNELMEENNSNL